MNIGSIFPELQVWQFRIFHFSYQFHILWAVRISVTKQYLESPSIVQKLIRCKAEVNSVQGSA